LTDTDKQNSTGKYTNRIQLRKAQNTAKQNYPDSVISYDNRPGNETGLIQRSRAHTGCWLAWETKENQQCDYYVMSNSYSNRLLIINYKLCLERGVVVIFNRFRCRLMVSQLKVRPLTLLRMQCTASAVPE